MRRHSRSAPGRSHGRSRSRHRRGTVVTAAVLALSVSGLVAASTSA